MSLTARLANTAWFVASRPAAAAFERDLGRCEETQWWVLHAQLRRNEDCAYGKLRGFADIRSYADFAKRVPIIDYTDLEPFIGKIQTGEKSVLTTEPVTHLVPTSGSSGARKLIPFTDSFQREVKAAVAPWIVDLFRSNREIMKGRAYWSVTPAIASDENGRSAVPVGFEDDSNYLGGVWERLVRATMAAPSSLRKLTRMDVFRYAASLCLLRCEDLRLISVWHPSFLSLLLDGLPGIWEDLLADLRRGTFRFAREIPPDVLRDLQLRPCADRVAQLGRADPCRPHTLWPDLQVISCWGDANARMPADDLGKRFPSARIQAKGLLATEAFVTIPFSGAHPLAIRSHFFEFLAGDGRVFPANALSIGAEYELIVTTGAGLWRYRLGDQVKVMSQLGTTPTLEFLGRGDAVCDLCGEKLSEAFAANVIKALNLAGSFAMFAPEKTSDGWRYVLFVDGEARSLLAEEADTLLRQNPHYAYCRDLGQLANVSVITVPRHAYATYAKAEQNRGKRLGDIKPVALSSRADWRATFMGIPSG